MKTGGFSLCKVWFLPHHPRMAPGYKEGQTMSLFGRSPLVNLSSILRNTRGRLGGTSIVSHLLLKCSMMPSLLCFWIPEWEAGHTCSLLWLLLPTIWGFTLVSTSAIVQPQGKVGATVGIPMSDLSSFLPLSFYLQSRSISISSLGVCEIPLSYSLSSCYLQFIITLDIQTFKLWF